MKENYEKEFSKVPELIDVPVKTGSTKIFRTNESYVSDLNYVTTLKAENERKIESLNKKIEMLTGNYERNETQRQITPSQLLPRQQIAEGQIGEDLETIGTVGGEMLRSET